MQLVTYYFHGIVREVHKKCMKVQTSSRSNPNERDIVSLRVHADTSNAGVLWFDSSSDFLTVKFHNTSHFLVCADQWNEHLSNLVCIHVGCKYVYVILR